MNRLCKVAITCPGPDPGLEGDSPVSNYTAELPDTLTFEGFQFPIFDQNNTIGGTDTTGPFAPWLAYGCQSFCLSFVSADDASACAARLAFICAHKKTTGPDPVFFFNSQQSCPFTCPDGTLYVYTVAPGYFVALSQEEADALARSLACERAIANHVCLGNFNPACCVRSLYNSTIQLFGVFPLVVTVVSGQLPPGFDLSQDAAGQTATITGSCNVPGSYQFALMATDPNGNFHVKNYTINVLGISNVASLPQPTVARPYSAQLQATGGTAPFTFGTIGGLPTGLSVSSTGLISGTPSVHYSGAFSATFTVTDATGLSCFEIWNSSTLEPPGPDWTQLNWTSYPLIQGNPANSVSGAGNKATAFASLTCNTGLANPKITGVAASGVSYTGGIVNCRLQVVVTATAPGNNTMTCRILRNGAQIPGAGYAQPFNAPGTYNFDFAVPASVGAVFTIDDASPGNNWALITASGFAGTPLHLDFTWSVFNL